jgi:hypothetical protein
MSAITLCSTMPKYEKYREAWDLLREASGNEKSPLEPAAGLNGARVGEFEEEPKGPAMARMQAAMNSFRNYLEKSRAPR